MSPGSEQLLVDFRSPAGARASHCRGTLLVSSLATLRKHGHFERYLGLLPAAARDDIQHVVANTWLPISLLTAHYETCEALALSTQELDTIADEVSNRLAETFIATFLRSTRQLGGSPWGSLGQAHLLWSRLVQGGGVRVRREGPKDARVDSHGLPLFDIPYFARGYCAMLRGAALLVSSIVYARQLPRSAPASHAALLSWV